MKEDSQKNFSKKNLKFTEKFQNVELLWKSAKNTICFSTHLSPHSWESETVCLRHSALGCVSCHLSSLFFCVCFAFAVTLSFYFPLESAGFVCYALEQVVFKTLLFCKRFPFILTTHSTNTRIFFKQRHWNHPKMGKKKVKPNAFSAFMHEFIQKERRAGRHHAKVSQS